MESNILDRSCHHGYSQHPHPSGIATTTPLEILLSNSHYCLTSLKDEITNSSSTFPGSPLASEGITRISLTEFSRVNCVITHGGISHSTCEVWTRVH